MPKVTVFMPVYNTEKYLEKSIRSILNQTFKDFELLIIDDGSTDKSKEIINKFKDTRIRLIENEVNKGLPYTRNLGLRLAKGLYFAIMDSDDIARKDRLKEQVSILDKKNDIGVVTSNERVIYKTFPIKVVKRKQKSDFLKLLLLFENCIGNTTVMFRKNILDEIIYQKDFFVCQDYKFWVDLSSKTKFTSINKSLMSYRTGHENITKKSKKNKEKERNALLLKIRQDAFELNKISISDIELNKLNDFLNKKDKSLEKFQKIECVFNRITNHNKENNDLIAVIKYVLSQELKICNGSILQKKKIMSNLEKNLPISFNFIDDIQLLYRNFYNIFRNLIN
ncbi:glycosyltransferase [Bacillus sp. AFS017336]|uniref:glycosyltransferase family 2 protein n=1 Tax=Bacillus sp. AFS017336 TaxID=2033489 RepID=UPI000BF02154|nr:glycosyltransferase [Bacillus sp. AFS017336]PEL13552.1 hypothetical protein CN601_03855 [Bacillus sp. AFS017336]